jgi:carboxypeptidase T
MESADRAAVITLANYMRDAIQAVRGRAYKVEQSLALYPTAGTSDDYAFSRHLVDHSKGKVYSYTIEWGSENNPTPFHPRYSEMQQIIQEITAGLIEFCWRAGT